MFSLQWNIYLLLIWISYGRIVQAMVNDEAISEFLCSFYLKGLGDCIVADDSDDDDGSLPSFLIFYVDHSF